MTLNPVVNLKSPLVQPLVPVVTLDVIIKSLCGHAQPNSAQTCDIHVQVSNVFCRSASSESDAVRCECRRFVFDVAHVASRPQLVASHLLAHLSPQPGSTHLLFLQSKILHIMNCHHILASIFDLELLVCAHHAFTLACDMQGICTTLHRCRLLAQNLLDQQLYHELVIYLLPSHTCTPVHERNMNKLILIHILTFR